MGESREQSFFKKHWEGYKELWGERNYSKYIKRDKSLSSWSSSDVDEFITSDLVHGPTTAREAVGFAISGSLNEAASTAGIAWKYSRS